VAELKACSRSEAEQYIAGGWVSVDGQLVEEPQFRVLPMHNVTIAADASLVALAPVTLLLHKPPGYEDGTEFLAFARAGKRPPLLAGRLLGPDSHWPQDPLQPRLLKRHFHKLAVPVTLEPLASGLLVFTQDWRVARKLTEEASVLEHEFIVEVEGKPSPQDIAALNQGGPPASDDHSQPHIRVSLSSSGDGSSRLRFAVKGAHPGLIAHLCERAQWKLLALKRMRIGRVALAHLPQGQWRFLAGYERF
jgi:23S rRNA pseudouridine2604 synthase